MENILNFLKWQLLARLPKGSIYERIRESKLNDGISKNDPYYFIYWLDINRGLLQKYLLGTFKTRNEDYENFINWLNESYLTNGIYEIPINNSVIKIPTPLFQDYKCFKAEFLDIIMPSIVKHRKMPQPFLEGPYEYLNVSLTEGDIVLDLGANFGLFSSLASSKNCEVYAFEPTLRIVKDYLNRLKEIDENITVIKKAISNYTGTSLFRVYNNKPSCNHLEQKDNLKQGTYNTIVDTITIDDFVSDENLNSVDFIKADIEGAERLMLEGAKRTLKEYAPKLAICYYHCLDDLKVLQKLILDANPDYEIEVKYKKIYARVPKKDKRF